MHTTDKAVGPQSTLKVARNLIPSSSATSAGGRPPRLHENFGRVVALAQMHTNVTTTAPPSTPTVAKNWWPPLPSSWKSKTICPMMAEDSEALCHSLLKPHDQNMGVHDRITSDPAIYRHQAPKGDRRRSLPELVTAQINEGRH
jgi:hypothetical protein